MRVDYGSLITALASTTQLNGIQASCRRLHDARSSTARSPRRPQARRADDDGGRQAYLKVAKVCIGMLKAPEARDAVAAGRAER